MPRALNLLLPLGLMGGLYFLSSIPGSAEAGAPGLVLWVSPNLQNALHVPVFGSLAWAWFWSLRKLDWSVSQALWVAATVSIVYGVFDEWHQSWVPGRFLTVSDAALNALGIAIAAGLIRRLAITARETGR